MGGVSFADDIKLIYICMQYAAEFDIQFNGAKSKHMICKGRHCVVQRCFL